MVLEVGGSRPLTHPGDDVPRLVERGRRRTTLAGSQRRAPLAQLAEQRTLNPQVLGSSPRGRTAPKPARNGGFRRSRGQVVHSPIARPSRGVGGRALVGLVPGRRGRSERECGKSAPTPDEIRFRAHATEAAEQVLADRRVFQLDAAGWNEFVQVLDRPMQFKPRLNSLLGTPTVLDA